MVEWIWNPPFQVRSAEIAVVEEKASLTVQGRNGNTVDILASDVQKALSMPSAKLMSR